MEKLNEEKAVITVFVVILVLVCLIIISIYLLNEQRSNIQFELIGKQDITIEVGNEYKDQGVIAKSNNKNINDKVKISSNVNIYKVGNYNVEYNLKIISLGINKTLYRKVYVRDTTNPVLTIDSEKEVSIDIGEKYSYPTYTAIDNYNGDITDKVSVETNLNSNEEGTYEINYCVNDSSQNEVTDKIIVKVKKKKNPYIIVSISKQTLQYYEYDKVVVSSSIVTGINNKTPTGTFKVLNKAKDIILKGKDYESFVSYWIAFRGNSLGFHDASWRSKFGGNIYKTNGSHGCVNMPYNKVKQLYNMVSVGTPVYIKK